MKYLKPLSLIIFLVFASLKIQATEPGQQHEKPSEVVDQYGLTMEY